jgi:hypothetical protein
MGITKKHYKTIFKKEDYKGRTNNRNNLILLVSAISGGVFTMFCSIFAPAQTGRGVRVVEGASLESLYTRKGIAGSNPALSAIKVESNPVTGLLFV